MNLIDKYRFLLSLKNLKCNFASNRIRSGRIQNVSTSIVAVGAAIGTSLFVCPKVVGIRHATMILCEDNNIDAEGNNSFQGDGDYLQSLFEKRTPNRMEKQAQSLLNYFHLADLPAILSIPFLILVTSLVDLSSWYAYCHLKTAQHMTSVRDSFVKDYYKGTSGIPAGSPFHPTNFWMRFNKDVLSKRIILAMMCLCEAYLMWMAIIIFAKGSDRVIKNPYDDDDVVGVGLDDNGGSGINMKEQSLTQMLWCTTDKDDIYTNVTVAILLTLKPLMRGDPRFFFFFPMAYFLAYVANHIPVGYSCIALAWITTVFLNMKLANYFWLSRILNKEQLAVLERLYRGHFERTANIYKLKK